jgi:hypothetical protein
MKGASGLCRRLRDLATAHLLRLEVLVEQVERLLVGAGAAGDGEHALSSLVVGSLGNADAGAGRLADLADLAASTANDAANHVGRNGDVLSLDVFTLLDSRRSETAGTNVRTRRVGRRRRGGEVGTVSSTVEAARCAISGTVGSAGGTASLDADRRAVENSAVTALLVVDEALADLPDSLLDTIGSALDLDNALSRLREHFLLRDHADTGSVLDLLDLGALTADDGSHLVVRNEKTDGYMNVSKPNRQCNQALLTYGECWGLRRHRPCPSAARP